MLVCTLHTSRTTSVSISISREVFGRIRLHNLKPLLNIRIQINLEIAKIAVLNAPRYKSCIPFSVPHLNTV